MYGRWRDRCFYPEDFAMFKKQVAARIKGEDEDMARIDELDARITKLESSDEKEYNTIDEVPEWGKDAIKWCVDNKILTGDLNGLNLTYSMLRMAVMLYRAEQVAQNK